MDIYDGIVIIGFVLVVAGLSMWSVPAALVAAGIGLAAIGVLGAIGRAERKRSGPSKDRETGK